MTLGYHELAEEFLALSIYDPDQARMFYTVYSQLLTIPASNVLSLSHNAVQIANKEMITDRLALLGKDPSQELTKSAVSLTVPLEIGQFLVRKLAFGAIGYEGSKRLIDVYNDADIQKLIGALQKGTRDMHPADIISAGSDLQMHLMECGRTARVSPANRRISAMEYPWGLR